MKNLWYYDLDIGKIGIAAENGCIVQVLFERDKCPPNFEAAKTPLTDNAAEQLGQYLKGNRKEFELPLLPKGTDFQRAVWTALQTIAWGETRSYKEVAQQIGKPKAIRAVGAANGQNPIPIIIPCHRVIGTNGNLTGYGGGLAIKKRLLQLEGCL